ncbi:MATE family efflux transporter [Methanobrevibacter boviskoreani]|uniref:MATE family efflux transporter n=1 Tax=Methanobrevibacter boviskoreani TaxID=1348249 RepID=UPI0023A81934|nr:MATE family efflux transporter [Methanobrevibacter boviskoreani]MCI6774407.1 MATE family efflux transporter [Methanobrevibacter boviskoreani]MDY5613866.1 MATE family efflux transporter [Methanobrevibacter boviskoreani]
MVGTLDNTKGVDILLGDPKKALWNTSIPLIISLFISSLYNLIDAIWVSGLGANQLAAVGFIMPIFTALLGIGNGLAAGSSSALSKYIGEDDKRRADNGSIHTILITLIISIITTVILLVFLKPILIFIGAGNTISYSLDYGYIIVLGSVFIILSNSLYGVLRGEGDSNRTMYAMLFSSILNIILDPIFIYGLNLGIRGAAVATVISLVFVNLILMYWFYIKKDTYLKPFIGNFKFDLDITRDILKVGLPASLELINNAVFAALFSMLLAYIGTTDAVAVYSTGWRVVTVATTPILAIATALISVVGVNYGRKNYENIRMAHRYSVKMGILFGLIAAVIVYVFAPQIVAVFTYGGTSQRLNGSLISFLLCIVFFFPTMGYGATSTYVFQGVGKGITAMFQTILRETVFTLAFAIFLSIYLGWGVYGAWLGIVLGELVVNTITMVWADLYIGGLIKGSS